MTHLKTHLMSHHVPLAPARRRLSQPALPADARRGRRAHDHIELMAAIGRHEGAARAGPPLLMDLFVAPDTCASR